MNSQKHQLAFKARWPYEGDHIGNMFPYNWYREQQKIDKYSGRKMQSGKPQPKNK